MCKEIGSKMSPAVFVSGAAVQGNCPATHVCVFGFQSALKGSPWGLMQALEQQVEELRMDEAEGCDGAPGETGEERPCCFQTRFHVFLSDPMFVLHLQVYAQKFICASF